MNTLFVSATATAYAETRPRQREAARAGARERVRGDAAEEEERRERRLAADPVDEPDRGRVARELRERREREQRVDVDREVLLGLKHERQPQEEAVVGDVERDPDESGGRRPRTQPLRQQLAHRGARLLPGRRELARLDRTARDLAQDLGGL